MGRTPPRGPPPRRGPGAGSALPAPAPPEGATARLPLRPQLAVAANARELPARGVEALRLRERRGEARDLPLQPADPLQILVLTEGGFHRPPDRLPIVGGAPPAGHRATPQP